MVLQTNKVLHAVGHGSPPWELGGEPVASLPLIQVAASMQALVSSPATTLAFHDFEDGTIGPFWDPWAGLGANPTFPNDPTPRATGKVARLGPYAPSPGLSHERGIAWSNASNGAPLGAGDPEVWFQGDVYLPQNDAEDPASDPDFGVNDTRKLIDWQGTGSGRIVILRHNDGNGTLRVTIDRCSGGSIFANTTGIINFDTWHRIKVRYKPNSAWAVADAILQIWLDGTLVYTNTSFYLAGATGSCGTSALNTLMFGYQLTISGANAYTEPRYWDNCGYFDGDPS